MKRLLVAVSVLALAGCSSSSTDPEPDGFSQGEAEALASQIARALGNGMATAASAPPAAAAAAAVPVNVQLDSRTDCTAGGHIRVSGSLTGNVDEHGSGALFLQVLETLHDWRCVGGWVVNGAPYLSAAGTFTFLDGAQSGTASISFGGAVAWGSGTGEGCGVTLTALFRPDHTGRISGVVCSRSVDVTF